MNHDLVCPAGLGIAGWVVHKYYGGGIIAVRQLDHLSGINTGGIDGAPNQQFKA